MNRIRSRVDAASQRLQRAVVISALLWAAALVMAALMGLVLLQWFVPPLTWAPAWGVAVALTIGLAAGALALWRNRYTRSPVRVALWMEEQQPGLDYALVSAADPRLASATLAPELLAHADQADVDLVVDLAVRPLVGWAFLALLAASTGLWLARRYSPAHLSGRPASATGVVIPVDAPSRLTPLRATVTPPAYSRLPARELREPEVIRALVGSRVQLSGAGAAEGITAVAGNDTLHATAVSGRWTLTTPIGGAPGVLVLTDRQYRRLVALDPEPDSIPVVALTAPEHDTTYYHLPSRPVLFGARARDDLGLASGYWEVLITTGSGEEFVTLTRLVGRVGLGGKRAASLHTAVRLDTLNLTPGSVVSVRAVVLDANDVGGPGRGTSETRTIRLAALADSSAAAAEPQHVHDGRGNATERRDIRLRAATHDRRGVWLWRVG